MDSNCPILIDFDMKYLYILYFFIANFVFFSYNNYENKLFNNIFSKLLNNFLYGIISLILYNIMKSFSKLLTKSFNLKKIKKKKILIPVLIIFMLSFIDDFFTFSMIDAYKDTFYNYSNFCLLSVIPFSYFLFKTKIHSHHLLSIILIFISTIIIIYHDNDYTKVILSIIYFIYFGFEMSFFKYYMEYYFINVYIVCLIQSIAAIAFNFCNIVYKLIKSEKNDFIEDFNELISNPFKFLIIAILYIFNFMSLKLGIFYLTPIHCMIGISLQCNIFFIYYNSFSNSLIIITTIRLIFEIFSLLIYNEIIILNFCGLEQNTRKVILIRENKERDKINEIVLPEKKESSDNDSSFGL